MSDFEEDHDDVTTIPFILTKAHDGEYDSEAFSAGWHLGVLDARVSLSELGTLIVPPILLRDKWKAQIDLIAMAHGMVVRVIPYDELPGYSVFSIAPAGAFREDEGL